MRKRLRFPLLVLPLLAVAAGLTASAWWSSARLQGSTGLAETFYQGTDFSGPPVLERTARTVDLSILDEHPSLPRRFFSLRFAGTWIVPAPGPVTLYAGGDDSVRVFVDNSLIVERNQERGFNTVAAATTLSAGPHQILVEYTQRGGGASLNVLWAPAGQGPRPIPREALFVAVPDADLIARSALAARLAVLARLAWIALAAVLLIRLSVWIGREARGWVTSGLVRSTVEHALGVTAGWQARYGRLAFWMASGAAVLWAAGSRMGALNPQTLWSDDVAVACLAKLDSLWTAIAVPAPLAPGFVALLWIARRAIADPEVSLQVLPFMLGLTGPLLVGVVVSRLTSSYLLGVAALVLGLWSPNLAQYSVFVKPYSMDYALAALLLWLAVRLLVERREEGQTVATAGIASVLFSMPSVFLSLALVHIGALTPGSNAANRGRWSTRRWATVVAFDVLLAVIYLVVLRSRSNPALRVWWTDSFVPVTSLTALLDFLRTTGWTAVREALPPPCMALAPLAAVGLAALVVSPTRRRFGAFVAVVYAGAIAASMLQIYPIGIGSKARVSIYSYAMTTMLVGVGFDALTRWMPLRGLARAAAAVGVVVCVTRVAPPAYPRLNQAELARTLESSAAPGDAIVLNTPAASLAGYYASWPIGTDADGSSYGFAVRIRRPGTLTLPRLSEEGGPGIDVLERFIDTERPATVFFFSTRRGTNTVEAAIRSRGFEEAWRKTGDVSALLVAYRRVGQQDRLEERRPTRPRDAGR